MRLFSETNGVSMLFVLSALVVTGFIGTSLISLNTVDKTANIFYKNSAAARSAAKSGMIAGLNILESAEKAEDNVRLLQRWIDANAQSDLSKNDLWIVGDDDTYVQLSDNLSYRTKLLAFDKEKFTITLRSEGAKTDGSKASVTGVYKLHGLEYSKSTANIPQNALHLGGGADEFNRALHVYGGTYMGGSGHCYDNTGGTYKFMGPFYLENSHPSDSFELKGAEFHSRSYFDGLFNVQVVASGNNCVFKKALGIETHMQVWSGAEFTVESEGIFANGSIGLPGDTKLNLLNNGEVKINKNQPYLYDCNNGGGIKDYSKIFENYTTFKRESFVDVKGILGISKPPQIFLDMVAIEQKAKTVSWWGNPDITLPYSCSGTHMNDLYDNYKESDFFVDSAGTKWMVLKIDATGPSFSEGGELFRGKVIWIIDRQVSFGTNFYNHERLGSEKGNSFIYIKNGGNMINFKPGPIYRGFIYSDTKKQNDIQAHKDHIFYGGLYQQNGGGMIKIDGPTTGEYGIFEIHYDSKVIEELRLLGIFSDGSSSDDKTLALQSNVTRIGSSLLSSVM